MAVAENPFIAAAVGPEVANFMEGTGADTTPPTKPASTRGGARPGAGAKKKTEKSDAAPEAKKNGQGRKLGSKNSKPTVSRWRPPVDDTEQENDPDTEKSSGSGRHLRTVSNENVLAVIEMLGNRGLAATAIGVSSTSINGYVSGKWGVGVAVDQSARFLIMSMGMRSYFVEAPAPAFEKVFDLITLLGGRMVFKRKLITNWIGIISVPGDHTQTVEKFGTKVAEQFKPIVL